MQHLGHALLGDKTYKNSKPILGLPPMTLTAVRNFPRQALHAYQLHLEHPVSKKPLEIQCEIPQDIQEIQTLLQQT